MRDFRVWLGVVGAAALLTTVACDKKSESSAAPAATPSAPAADKKVDKPAPPPAASAGKKAKPPPKTQKADLDAKPTPMAADKVTWLTIPGTNGTFAVPKTWKQHADTAWVTAGAPDDASGFVATTYKPGEDPTGKLGTLAKAMEFTDCEWGALSDITIGKDEFPAKEAEGLCLQKDLWNYVVYFLVPGDGLNVFILAGYDETAKDDQIHELDAILTSIKKKLEAS